jgi:hypothetical protein
MENMATSEQYKTFLQQIRNEIFESETGRVFILDNETVNKICNRLDALENCADYADLYHELSCSSIVQSKEMIGGFEYWAREGYPVESAAGPVSRAKDPLTVPISDINCEC